jgi:NAD(P)-dependent dehydrogenase (short-subunit alcohol dehydrogenase family)
VESCVCLRAQLSNLDRKQGRATACRFAQEGWNLALADIATFQVDDLLSVRQRVICLELAMDVTSAESVSAGVKLCTDTYGRLDVLINCAGKSLGPSDM